ncbi:fibroblast growth factor 17-like isoform X1 [Argiope bruennichi]|uniref:fibroblast growth factor 17-like isoform X1 n=1 Tax=Argiope bruennichi TaxID=94029 RepID=UPI00249413FB|nr:fibroblast growth factor 17-like isoform X1 [Argiope bruennichi]
MSSHAIDCPQCIQAADHHMYASRSPIYRLLVLLSVSILMATFSLALSPDALIESGSKFLSDNTITQYSIRRQYKFYNHCSAKQILIVGNSVSASGSQDSPNTNLILQSAHYKNHHGIQIIGATSGRYLCFSKKSKLITKFSGANPRCIFEELFSPDYYTVLRSVSNKDWLVGFNRRGKPILGSDTKTHRSRCYHFTKRDHSYLDALHKTRHFAPKISNPHKFLHLLHEKRTRRQKRHAFNEMRR